MPTLAEVVDSKVPGSEPESSGPFTADLEKALEKLGRSVLPDAESAVLKLIQFAVQRGALMVSLNRRRGRLKIAVIGITGDDTLGDLLESSGAGRDWTLGAAYFSVRGELLEHSTGPSRRQMTVRMRPRLLPWRLRERLAHCPVPVWLNGAVVSGQSWPRPVVDRRYDLGGFEVRLQLQSGGLLPRGRPEARVVPVQHGVTLDPFGLPAARRGIVLVMNADDLDTPMGSLQLREDDAWHARVALLSSLIETAVRELGPEPTPSAVLGAGTRGVARSMLASIDVTFALLGTAYLLGGVIEGDLHLSFPGIAVLWLAFRLALVGRAVGSATGRPVLEGGLRGGLLHGCDFCAGTTMLVCAGMWLSWWHERDTFPHDTVPLAAAALAWTVVRSLQAERRRRLDRFVV